VDFRVTPKGPSFEQLIRQTERDLKRANRRVAKPTSKAGIAAIKGGAPTFRGKQLTAKTDVHQSGDGVRITFWGTPAGAWSIKESGAVEHPIKPRKAQALAFPGAGRKTKGGRSGVTMSVKHPGVDGRGLWTQAGGRLEDAVGPVIEDVYDEALT
jgi:hypothetical protein